MGKPIESREVRQKVRAEYCDLELVARIVIQYARQIPCLVEPVPNGLVGISCQKMRRSCAPGRPSCLHASDYLRAAGRVGALLPWWQTGRMPLLASGLAQRDRRSATTTRRARRMCGKK